jgi:hypothetical protein
MITTVTGETNTYRIANHQDECRKQFCIASHIAHPAMLLLR